MQAKLILFLLLLFCLPNLHAHESLANTLRNTLEESLSDSIPEADFVYEQSGIIFAFADISTNEPTSWLWDFGDGSTSEEQHPQHVYAAPGAYTVCLTATNEWGSSQSCQTVMIIVGVDDLSKVEPAIRVFPNPANHSVVLEKLWQKDIDINIQDATGRQVQQLQLTQKRTQLSLDNWTAGVYIIRTEQGSKILIVE